jgi:hypothetical protein
VNQTTTSSMPTRDTKRHIERAVAATLRQVAKALRAQVAALLAQPDAAAQKCGAQLQQTVDVLTSPESASILVTDLCGMPDPVEPLSAAQRLALHQVVLGITAENAHRYEYVRAHYGSFLLDILLDGMHRPRAAQQDARAAGQLDMALDHLRRT